jgi:hypothetical protein
VATNPPSPSCGRGLRGIAAWERRIALRNVGGRLVRGTEEATMGDLWNGATSRERYLALAWGMLIPIGSAMRLAPLLWMEIPEDERAAIETWFQVGLSAA